MLISTGPIIEVPKESPIQHWSFSSLKLFLADRFAFREQYILGKWDNTKGPALIIGTAYHKALEQLYNGFPSGAAIAAGLRHIEEIPDAQIDYGKTGSREEIIKKYTQAINAYMEERPEFAKILGVEASMVTRICLDGEEMPLPIKAKIDLLTEDEQGRIIIRDHKSVSAYTDQEVENPERVLQAMFYFLAVKHYLGREPYSMVFDELKIGKNSDGSPQRKEYIILYDQHPEYMTFFRAIFTECTAEILRPDCSYLPNFSNMWTGQKSFDGFRARLLSSDIESLPKVRSLPAYKAAAQRAEQQYVPSFTDGVDVNNLSPEEKLQAKLQEFGLPVEMRETYRGPQIMKFTFKPSRGRRMAEYEKHAKDLALALRALTIRIEAPIMGTDLVGVEVPAEDRKFHSWSEDLCRPNTMLVPIGIDVYGKAIHKDLSRMPHLLIAGTTGSGKSVLTSVIVHTLAQQNDPDRVRLVLIDPKRVELARFKTLPHLDCPPIYDVNKATAMLWCLVDEMEERYSLLEEHGCRDIDEYNERVGVLPKIVVVIDEFADLILQKEKSEETTEVAIVRLAQKARAAGIHLILGTQRPSVDVVTGLLKANLPTRIALRTAAQVDSRVILDREGAEQLLNKGDLLMLDPGERDLIRLQSFSL